MRRIQSAVLDRVGAGKADLTISRPQLPSAVLPHRIDTRPSPLAAAPGQALRRLLFVWLRIYVLEERAGGATSRVNLRIPIPVPLVGAFLRRQARAGGALAHLAGPDSRYDLNDEFVSRVAESLMGLELLRVHEERHGKRELVVIGLD